MRTGAYCLLVVNRFPGSYCLPRSRQYCAPGINWSTRIGTAKYFPGAYSERKYTMVCASIGPGYKLGVE